MSYLTQINRAIDHIEANLPGPLSMQDSAREAGLSRWHFQRIFAATVGDTVGAYINARRLSYAARQLIETKDRVIDVAFECDYGSHAVFTRAFKRLFKMTPSAFRRAKKNGALIPQKAQVTTAYLEHLYRGISMQPEIKQLDAFSVIGIAGHFAPLDNPNPTNMMVIPKLWQTFRSHARYLPSESIGLRVGVTGGGPAVEGKLEYLAGRKILVDAEVPKGFEVRTVPAGAYAKFTHKGPVRTINHTMQYIFGSWLPRSGRELGDGPEFSLYPPEYEPTSLDGELYIFIPLK